MAMSEADRAATSIALQRFFSQAAASVGITKPELKDAIDAIDNWCDTNAASFNTAIPQPARSTLTTAQKAIALAYVAMRRAGGLRIDEDG